MIPRADGVYPGVIRFKEGLTTVDGHNDVDYLSHTGNMYSNVDIGTSYHIWYGMKRRGETRLERRLLEDS